MILCYKNFFLSCLRLASFKLIKVTHAFQLVLGAKIGRIFMIFLSLTRRDPVLASLLIFWSLIQNFGMKTKIVLSLMILLRMKFQTFQLTMLILMTPFVGLTLLMQIVQQKMHTKLLCGKSDIALFEDEHLLRIKNFLSQIGFGKAKPWTLGSNFLLGWSLGELLHRYWELIGILKEWCRCGHIELDLHLFFQCSLSR